MVHNFLPSFRRFFLFRLNFSYLVLLLAFTLRTSAQPAPLLFTDCSSGVNLSPSLRINISSVYGQIITDSSGSGKTLNLVAFGDTGKAIEPFSNVTNLLGKPNFISLP